MVNGAYRTQLLMRLTLGCTMVFLAGLWITNWMLHVRLLGLSPAGVVRHYLGSEAEFLPPRTLGSMLEVTHAHFAVMAVVLLLVTHLAIFFPWSLRLRVTLVLITFGAALLQEASGWLVRFVHPGFAWVKVASFLGLQAAMLVLLAGLGWHLAVRPRPPREMFGRGDG
jgi:hypothetical protein